ncbi:HNH endonuclease [Macrococcoides goetzii]
MYETTKERIKFYKSRTWKRKRDEILKRDCYECQECKKEGKVSIDLNRFGQGTKHKYLDVDHIEELQKRPELALVDSNLVTLCIKCHNKKHDRYQKKNKKWNDEKW